MPASTTDDARERLIRAASQLMYDGGYEAVGVADICRHADTRKGSFYNFFESKQALAIETLERSWGWTRRAIFEPAFGADPAAGTCDDATTIGAFTAYGNLLADNLARQFDETGFVSGCRFGNFAAELATRDDLVRASVETIFTEMAALFAAVIRRGQDRGEIDTGVDADATARHVLAHMEGLMILAKSARDPELLRTLGPAVQRLVP